jgi:hypothetical protein
MVENETLKKEVDKITRGLGNAYGGDARLLKCWVAKGFSISKKGLTIPPRKARPPLSLQSLAL